MNFSRYLNYETAEFLEDDYFVDWCISPTEDSAVFWKTFLQQNPQKEEAVKQAAEIVKVYRRQEVFTNEARQGAVWERIQQTLRQDTSPAARIFRMSVLLRAAAIVGIMLTTGLCYWIYQNQNVTVSTSYGQVKTIILPDHSSVTLNGNSTLTYVRSWNSSIREVWIKGEGLFKVIHLNKNPRQVKESERFIVHCQNLNVEVLGTTFNVKDRHYKTDVSLITGKIMIDYEDGNLQQRVRGLVMKPGDFIEYSRQHITTRVTLPQPQASIQWTQHQLWFTNAKLKDIAETLEDSYGYEITFTDSALADRKIEGEIRVADVSQLLETIRTTLDVKINEENNQIIISSINPN